MQNDPVPIPIVSHDKTSMIAAGPQVEIRNCSCALTAVVVCGAAGVRPEPWFAAIERNDTLRAGALHLAANAKAVLAERR